MGDVGEEIDLRVVEFLLRLDLDPFHLAGHLEPSEIVPLPGDQQQEGQEQQRIDRQGGFGKIERRDDFDVQGAGGMLPCSDTAHPEPVFPGGEVRIGGLAGGGKALDGLPFPLQDRPEHADAGGLEVRGCIVEGQGGKVLVADADFPGPERGFSLFRHREGAARPAYGNVRDIQFQRLPAGPVSGREAHESPAGPEEELSAGGGTGGPVGILVHQFAVLFQVHFPDGQVVRVKFDDAVGGGQPEDPVQVFLDAAGDGSGESVSAGNVAETEIAVPDLQQSGVAGAARFRQDPESVPAVFPDAGDVVRGQARLRVPGEMPEFPSLAGPDAVSVGSDPEVAQRILEQGVDEIAAGFGTRVEAVRRTVVPVQAGGRAHVKFTAAGIQDAGGRQAGQVVLRYLPTGEIHPVHAVSEGRDPQVVPFQAEPLDVEHAAFGTGESQVFHAIVRQVQQGESAVFGAAQDVPVIDRDDRPDHAAAEVPAFPAAQVAGHQVLRVPQEGETVVEQAHPQVSLAVAEHGPDILACDGFRIGPVMGVVPHPVPVQEDEAPVGAQGAAAVRTGDDAADFSSLRPVSDGRGVREDVRLKDQAARDGGKDVPGAVRNEVLAGEHFARPVPDPFEPAAPGLETIQVSAGGEEPDGAVAVGLDRVAAELRQGGVIREPPGGGVPAVDVLVGEPDHAAAVHGDVPGAHHDAGCVPVDGPGLPGGKVQIADSPRGDEPEMVLPVLRQGEGEPVQDVAGRIFQRLEMQAVVHTDAFARAQPDEAVAVLEDGADRIVRQAVVGAVVPEPERGVLRLRGQGQDYQEGEK